MIFRAFIHQNTDPAPQGSPASSSYGRLKMFLYGALLPGKGRYGSIQIYGRESFS